MPITVESQNSQSHTVGSGANVVKIVVDRHQYCAADNESEQTL